MTDAEWVNEVMADQNWLEQLSVGGQRPTLVGVEVEPVNDPELPRFTQLSLRVESISTPVVVRWAEEYGFLVLRHADSNYSALLEPGQASAPIGQRVSSVSVMQTYLISGIQHIIPMGLDHILFVAGLFFFGARWGALLAQVSVFTVAHTLTLSLASLSILTISPAIVEPLIAASIVYVGVENCLTKKPGSLARRLALIFVFGLLHGLGFARYWPNSVLMKVRLR